MSNIPVRITRALDIINQLGEPFGDMEKGEHQLVTDPAEILKLEEKFKQRYQDEKYAHQPNRDMWHLSGLMAEDPFYLHLKMFYKRKDQQGKVEHVLYNKVLWTALKNGSSGVAILVVTEDGKVVLNRSYRPSLMAWIIETPGTMRRPQESTEECLKRCVQDEIGLNMLSYELLNEKFVPERGVMGGVVPVYFVKVAAGQARPSESSVRENVMLSKEELVAALETGIYDYKEQAHLCYEGYLVSLLYLAEKKNLL